MLKPWSRAWHNASVPHRVDKRTVKARALVDVAGHKRGLKKLFDDDDGVDIIWSHDLHVAIPAAPSSRDLPVMCPT